MRSFTLAAAVGLLLWTPALCQAGATIEIDDEKYITLGAGLRTSFLTQEDSPPGEDDREFALESWRFYSGGRLHENISIEFNADYEQGDPDDEKLRVLDGIVKLEFNDYLNFWAGRFLPPSDRSNLSGPYFINSFDFPFVQQYPNIFAGRDDGVAYWGQVGEGRFKWQLGAFDGTTATDNDDLLHAGRVVLNLWDPEPGYYNSSTYYGEKDVLALGLVYQGQKDGASTATTDGDFRGWNVDLLMEKKFDFGALTFEGAYYDYDLDDLDLLADPDAASKEGIGYFILGSWLLPQTLTVGGISGHLQPLVRFQRFDPELSGADDHDRIDVGLNFIISGHNARLSFVYSRDEDTPGLSPTADSTRNLFKLGLQFQL